MAIALLALLFVSLSLLTLNILAAEVSMIGSTLTSLIGGSFISVHFTLGVVASVLCLFSVVITMFYFIGTGRAVKDSVKDYGLDRRYYQMILKYKRKYFPVMTLALVIYIALPTLGAAAQAKYIAPGFHGLFSYITLVTHAFVCYQGWGYIFENERVVATVNRLVREHQEAGGVA